MAELVDALASGASAREGVEVRVLFWAPSCIDFSKLFNIIIDLPLLHGTQFGT